MRSFLASALFLAIAILPVSASAQEIPTATSTSAPASASDQLESCFDYYRFGSVPVTLTSDATQVSQGSSITVHALITNQNSYPVENITVLGKVFYKKDFNKTSYGPDVIQLLVLGKGITLKAGESRALTYTWDVPPKTLPGNYQIAAYVNSFDRFNMAGLPFTNDVVGTLLNFSVVGSDVGAVRFDNTQTYVNGVNFHGTAFSPQTLTKPSGTPVYMTIDNTTHHYFTGTVHWEVYSWDGSNAANLITQSDQPVHVNGSGSTTVTYTITDASHTVYYAVAELKSADGEVLSVEPIRYVQSRGVGLDLPRIAFFGAATSTNASSTKALRAFACVHSTGHRSSQNTKVVVSAVPLDPVSWLLHLGSLGHRTYAGDLPGRLAAVSVPISPANGDFKVTASVYQGGALIDSVTSTYSCTDFNDCSSSRLLYAVLLIVGLVVLIICIYLLRRHPAAAPATFSQPNV